MRIFIILLLGLFIQETVFAQNNVSVVVKDSKTKEVLIGANVAETGTSNGAVTDANGVAKLSTDHTGLISLEVRYMGYETSTIKVKVPQTTPNIDVFLDPTTQNLEEVTVTSVRTNSRIEAVPTRIEVLGTEDVNEENGIHPANISSLIGDIAGMQMQEASAATGNTFARIQGLNGRYTQILRDGMPLYGGMSGNFSLLQIPPLDLKQIEIIKGSCSTLYGGDAIAGIINLISKEPEQKQNISATLNETSLKETNLNAYLSKRYKTFGYTFLVGQTWRKPTDTNNDGLSDVSRVNSTIIHPTFFFYLSPKSTLTADYSGIFDKRTGGDMHYLSNPIDTLYHVQTHSTRHSITAKYVDNITENSNLTVKASGSSLQQTINTKWYNFDATQSLFYSEISYFRQFEKMNWVIGINANGDNFRNHSLQIPLSNYYNQTIGAFVQNTYNPTKSLTIETGFRADYTNRYGWFPLPRLSVMYKLDNHLTLRVNGGLGYKAPNVINYLDPETDLNHLSPVNNLKPEHSTGINADINYQNHFGNVNVTLNQAFFYSTISSPIDSLPNHPSIVLYNANKNMRTWGLQTYGRITIDELEIYLSYVYTNARKLYYPNQTPICTPKHDFSNTDMYEINNHWAVGIENSLFAGQVNQDYHSVPTYYIMAGMIRYKAGPLTFILNGENLFNIKQSHYEPIYDGSINNPQIRQLWAPIEGRTINLSLTWNL